MELNNQKRLVKHIFRLLKVNEIVIPIGRTNKGNLGLKFTENSEDFEIYLDAVPLSTKDALNDDNNIELKKMLEKYLFEPELKYNSNGTPWNPSKIVTFPTIVPNASTENSITINTKETPKKKGGRPKGSKNKVKDNGKDAH